MGRCFSCRGCGVAKAASEEWPTCGSESRRYVKHTSPGKRMRAPLRIYDDSARQWIPIMCRDLKLDCSDARRTVFLAEIWCPEVVLAGISFPCRDLAWISFPCRVRVE